MRSESHGHLEGYRVGQSVPGRDAPRQLPRRENEQAVQVPHQQLCPARIDNRAEYKSRWQVELFFKWIKQHLRIKSFYGTSENAVKTQIWISVSV